MQFLTIEKSKSVPLVRVMQKSNRTGYEQLTISNEQLALNSNRQEIEVRTYLPRPNRGPILSL